MNWRAGLAIAIACVWFFFLLHADDSPEAKARFDRMNPVALIAIGFLFTEPVARERLGRRTRRNDDEEDDRARRRDPEPEDDDERRAP